MEEQLRDIIREFGGNLSKSEYNQYIFKLRDYLIPYIKEKKKANFSVERIFKDEFTKSDIIDSTIYYVKKNQNVESVAAVEDFLIALNRLFDELIFERFPNPTLLKYKPFTVLKDEIIQYLLADGIALKEKEINPAIDDDQFEFIINYLNTSLKNYTAKTVIEVMLLYGLSHDIVAELPKEAYKENRRLLEMEYEKYGKKYSIFLEPPYSLANDLEKCKKERKNSKLDYLFLNQNGNKISNSFLTYTLNNIKTEYYLINRTVSTGDKNQFTPTGLQKYAIIQMILEGMNQSIIMDFTGQNQDIFSDCQDEVNKLKEVNRNRYINQFIRGISTYDKIM